MFTVEEVKNAHGKVKSGADFPAYIRDLKAMGVTYYEAYVVDGHIDYYGENDYMITVPAKYPPIDVAATPNMEVFKTELLAHQQGKTDYDTFIKMCGETGIAKWEINIGQLTCTYFDKNNIEVLTEYIPQ